MSCEDRLNESCGEGAVAPLPPSQESGNDDKYRCPHYKRKCRFVTPCCGGVYRCRFCHDEEQDHPLRREDVNVVECSACGTRQGVTEFCSNCGIKFGMYFCYECKLYDDEDKQQFHCQGCGICRVGGRANYFHCDRCDMCLPNHLEGAHKCVEKVSRGNCPVCQEDIHTSRIPSQIPPCNHLIHKNCFDDMLNNGHYACPVCGVSMIPMKEIWKIYDKDIEETPMPEEYRDLYANIKCRDCLQTSLASFHILGIKCNECGSYNTVRDKGPLKRLAPSMVATSFETQEVVDPSAVASGSMTPLDQEASGTLTPPETPNREDMSDTMSIGLAPYASAPTTTSTNLTLVSPPTPEPSPVREMQDADAAVSTSTFSLEHRQSNSLSRSAIRRLSFSSSATTAVPTLPLGSADNDYLWGVETGPMDEEAI